VVATSSGDGARAGTTAKTMNARIDGDGDEQGGDCSGTDGQNDGALAVAVAEARRRNYESAYANHIPTANPTVAFVTPAFSADLQGSAN